MIRYTILSVLTVALVETPVVAHPEYVSLTRTPSSWIELCPCPYECLWTGSTPSRTRCGGCELANGARPPLVKDPPLTHELLRYLSDEQMALHKFVAPNTVPGILTAESQYGEFSRSLPVIIPIVDPDTGPFSMSIGPGGRPVVELDLP